MTTTGLLHRADLDMFKRFGVDAELLALAGVRRVTHREARESIGIRYRSDHLEGLAFPYYDPSSGELLTYRLRRDHPEIEAGRPVAKYLEPPDRHRLFFVPGAGPLLADTSVTVVIVEAEKSALTLTAAAARSARHLLAMATGGCWAWKGIIGKTVDAAGARVNEKGPLPDLDRITWTQRDAVILFDANAAANGSVDAARKQLATELTRRGAIVRLGEIPADAGVNGPDDYRAQTTDAALLALVDRATALATPKSKTKATKSTQGRALALETPEPWPDPVNGAALVNGLAAMCAKYLALPAHAALALALWILHTYTLDAAYISPLLAVTSPVMQCGKSTLFIVLRALTPRALLTSGITAAALFRTIEKFHPTLFLDEVDTFLPENEHLRGILNAGHTRTTAQVIRTVGDENDVRAFSVWSAKAVALIGKLPATLADRAIEIRMRRRLPNETIDRLRQDRIEAEGEPWRRQAARWAADHLEALKEADPRVPAALQDRAADCWRPLLAIAEAIGGAIVTPEADSELSPAAGAAVALSGVSHAPDPDIGTELLKDIRLIFKDHAEEICDGAIRTDLLLAKLIEMADRPWPTFSRKTERPLTSHMLARLLKPFGILSAGLVTCPDGKRARGYRIDAFTETFTRYLPPDPVTEEEAF